MTPAQLREQHEEDLRAVMGTAAGRRFLWRLLEQAGLHGRSYAGAAEATAHNEGRRSVALDLLAEMQRVAPELYADSVEEWVGDFRARREAAPDALPANPDA